MFHDDNGSKVEKPRISKTRINHALKKFDYEVPCQDIKPFYKPAKRTDVSMDCAADPPALDQTFSKAVQRKDLGWSLARLDLIENEHPPTSNHWI